MVEKIIELSVRHKWVVFGVVLMLALFAANAARTTPLDALPDISDPQVIIFTEWMGRSPDLVEDQITYPLVRALQSTPGVRTCPRVLDVRHEFHVCPLRRGDRHLLGADARARAVGARAATAAARRVSDPRTRRERGGLGLSVRAEGQHRTDGSRRTARVAGLHRPTCTSGRRRRGGSRLPRGIRAPVPDRHRSRQARGLRTHGDRHHAIGPRCERGSGRSGARTGRS
jgi:hypothetical protein